MSNETISGVIAEAEEISDPLDNLAERCASDPGAAFHPDVLARLNELRGADQAAFETLRAGHKKAGVRVGELDRAMGGDGDGADRKTQAETLLAIASAAELFRNAAGDGFADIRVSGHRETWPIRSRGTRRWLAQRFFEDTGGAPCSEALSATLLVIEARAAFGGAERDVHLRVGSAAGKLYLDLCDSAWRAVEIDGAGWRIAAEPPVRFRRTAGMLSLPAPERGGTVDELRRFLNVGSADDFVLAVAWLLGALRDRGPYPVLALAGEQGSAKSTFATVLRSLVDPSSAPLRALPREDRDLFIGASNAHVLAYDNVTSLPGWISDTICRLATGGGFSVRHLYSDNEEVIFDAVRPVILNGIEDVVARPDLADRSIMLTLLPIEEAARRPAAEIQSELDAARPRILGAMLDCVSRGLRRLPTTHLALLPRMADFATWIAAAEPEAWRPGTMLNAYTGHLEDSVAVLIDGDPVACFVRAMMEAPNVTLVTQTAQDLLGAPIREGGDSATRGKDWPLTAKAMAGRLRRIAPLLRKVGIEITFAREATAARRRLIHFTRHTSLSAADREGNLASKPSKPSKEAREPHGDAVPHWTVGAASSSTTVQASSTTVQASSTTVQDSSTTVQDSSTTVQPPTAPSCHSSGVVDGLDDLDGSSPHFSASESVCAPDAGWHCPQCGGPHSEDADCLPAEERTLSTTALPAFAPGQRVVHPDEGVGTILHSTGGRWAVDFGGGVTRICVAGNLEVVS